MLQLRCIDFFGILHFAALGTGGIHFTRLESLMGQMKLASRLGRTDLCYPKKWIPKSSIHVFPLYSQYIIIISYHIIYIIIYIVCLLVNKQCSFPSSEMIHTMDHHGMSCGLASEARVFASFTGTSKVCATSALVHGIC